MNNINLIGYITKEVELKISPSGVSHASFTIAVKRQFKDKQTGEYQSDFINCKIFGKSAEFLTNYTNKGSQIGVQGSLQTGKYTNNEGVIVYTTDVMVNSVTLLDKKSDNNNDSNKNEVNSQTQGQQYQFNSSDLPF